MDFYYDPDSEYGLRVEDLRVLITTLQDGKKRYNSVDVHDVLSTIAAEALKIRRQIDRSAVAYDGARRL